jgi:hypothetical protein
VDSLADTANNNNKSRIFIEMNNVLNSDSNLQDHANQDRPCSHCTRQFANVQTTLQHQCLLLPSSEPGQVELRLLQGQILQQFLTDTAHNSDRQIMSLCSSLGLAVPGVWPLLFLRSGLSPLFVSRPYYSVSSARDSWVGRDSLP